MKYQNYIFDLYGTLADIRTDESSPLFWRRVALWYKEHGADWTGPALKAAYLRTCRLQQESSPDPLYELEIRTVFDALFREKAVLADPQLIEETACFFRICSLKKLKRYPWVKPLFAWLRSAGAGIYLLSNAQACFTLPELRFLELEDAFDGIVLSSEAAVRKPDPRIMQKLLEENGLSVRDSLMTGNDRLTDVAIARAAGMDCLYLETETSRRDLKVPAADYEILRGSPLSHPVFKTER
ncbi:MAG: HAD family hydrolase [Lachnospiraceae bacterium]|nr:HAD family hydrolase [Lachnospiraceae bacterium]